MENLVLNDAMRKNLFPNRRFVKRIMEFHFCRLALRYIFQPMEIMMVNHSGSFHGINLNTPNAASFYYFEDSPLLAVQKSPGEVHFFFRNDHEGMMARKSFIGGVAPLLKTKPASEEDYVKNVSEETVVRVSIAMKSLKTLQPSHFAHSSEKIPNLEHVPPTFTHKSASYTGNRITPVKDFFNHLESSGVMESLNVGEQFQEMVKALSHPSRTR